MVVTALVALALACGGRPPPPTTTLTIVERGSRLSFPPIEFERGSIELSEDARTLLDDVRDHLASRPHAMLVFENRDAAGADADLVNARVAAIEKYLRDAR